MCKILKFLLLFVMILPSYALAAKITYNLNNGQLPNGDTTYSTYSSGTEVVLDTPIRENYIFAGWVYCTESDYDSTTNTCTNPTRVITEHNSNYIRWIVPATSSDDIVYIAQWEQEKFQLTIDINQNEGDTFTFQMSASGQYFIDWGDGNTEYIDRTNNTTQATYSHTYTFKKHDFKARFGGTTTGYLQKTSEIAAINFGSLSFQNNAVIPVPADKIFGITGSIGSLFPTISASQQPTFNYTFLGAQFTSIPANLFSGITGGRTLMFNYTFAASALQTIPEHLFDNMTADKYMYEGTFLGCYNLTSIPENLFVGATDNKTDHGTFRDTFGAYFDAQGNVIWSCTSLTQLPNSLFPNITIAKTDMFTRMFAGASNLSGYVPSTLFGNLDSSNYSSGPMAGIFIGTNLATTCPNGTTEVTPNNLMVDWYKNLSCTDPTDTNCAFAVSCLGFTCDSGVELSMLGAPMCLIPGLPQNNELGLIVRKNGNQYHMLLSTTEQVIHSGSEHKVKIITNNATYYVHDESVTE